MNTAAIAWLGRQIAWEGRLSELRHGLARRLDEAPVAQAVPVAQAA